MNDCVMCPLESHNFHKKLLADAIRNDTLRERELVGNTGLLNTAKRRVMWTIRVTLGVAITFTTMSVLHNGISSVGYLIAILLPLIGIALLVLLPRIVTARQRSYLKKIDGKMVLCLRDGRVLMEHLVSDSFSWGNLFEGGSFVTTDMNGIPHKNYFYSSVKECL